MSDMHFLDFNRRVSLLSDFMQQHGSRRLIVGRPAQEGKFLYTGSPHAPSSRQIIPDAVKNIVNYRVYILTNTTNRLPRHYVGLYPVVSGHYATLMEESEAELFNSSDILQGSDGITQRETWSSNTTYHFKSDFARDLSHVVLKRMDLFDVFGDNLMLYHPTKHEYSYRAGGINKNWKLVAGWLFPKSVILYEWLRAGHDTQPAGRDMTQVLEGLIQDRESKFKAWSKVRPGPVIKNGKYKPKPRSRCKIKTRILPPISYSAVTPDVTPFVNENSYDVLRNHYQIGHNQYVGVLARDHFKRRDYSPMGINRMWPVEVRSV
jgi:hypothetical protein